MVYKIFWTNVGEVSLEKTLEFLHENWNENVVSDFLDRIDSISRQLEINPLIFPNSFKFSNYHKATIHKNVSLFYKIDNLTSTVYVSLIWSNKMNPNNLQKLLK